MVWQNMINKGKQQHRSILLRHDRARPTQSLASLNAESFPTANAETTSRLAANSASHS
jgi:hypothetical protein